MDMAGKKYPKGTLIHVNITARISSSREKGDNATTRVDQTENGRSRHFLFLSSSLVIQAPENVVTARFNARVIGPYKAGILNTTLVQEVRPNGIFGFIHYLFLESEAITVAELTGKETSGAITAMPGGPQPVSALIRAGKVPVKKELILVTITRSKTVITSEEVRDRIIALEDKQLYEVFRPRDSRVLRECPDREDAERYIDNEGYDPARVIVRQQELGASDTAELSRLRALADEIPARGLNAPWTIYNENFFTASWAQDEAVSQLGISRDDLDAWPLSQLDWTALAEKRRDDLYGLTLLFDGALYCA